MRESMAEMRGALSQRQTPAETPKPTTDYGKRLDEIEAQADRDLALASTTGDKDAMKRYYAGQREIAKVIAQQEFAELSKTLPRTESGGNAVQTIVEADFPWVATNEKARRWAAAAEDQLLVEGRPATIATTREVLALAAVKFNLGGGRAPAADSRRYGGGPSSDDGESSGVTKVAFPAESMAIVKSYANSHNITMEKAMEIMGSKLKKASAG
jgi:hypothetical protein